jgi:hypothetical protein
VIEQRSWTAAAASPVAVHDDIDQISVALVPWR